MMRWAHCTWLGAVLAAIAIGCDRPNAPKGAKKPASVPADTSSTEDAKEDRAGAELLGSIAGVLEHSTDISTFGTVVKQLNEYFSLRQQTLKPIPDDLRKRIAEEAGPRSLLDAERREFDGSDAEYLRRSILLNTIARSQLHEREDDAAYVRRLFDWTIDNLEWTPDGVFPEGPPVDVCLRGIASTRERSWVFIELLRQAGFDGCLIFRNPGNKLGPSEALARPWLCGWSTGSDIYLFEPELGLPVFADDKGKVATLRELLQHPEWLARYKSAPRYADAFPLKADELTVGVAYFPGMSAPRMAEVEARLGNAVRAHLTLDYPAWRGRIEKSVAASFGNNKDSVAIWEFPREVEDSLRKPQNWMKLIYSINPVWIQLPKSPRLIQIRGELDQAVAEYVRLDQMPREDMYRFLMERRVPGAAVTELAGRAREDILYFVGLCKIGTNPPDLAGARDWLDRYLHQHGSPIIRADNVNDWTRFCIIMSKAPAANQFAPERRVWDLLGEKERAILREAETQLAPVYQIHNELKQWQAAYDEMRGELEMRGAVEQQDRDDETQKEFAEISKTIQQKNTQLRKAYRFEVSSRTQFLAALNEILQRRDFYEPAHFVAITKSPTLDNLLQRPANSLSETEILVRNRKLLEASFPGVFTAYESRWTAGAIRQYAIALHRDGKKADAIAWLRQSRPELLPTQQAALKVLADIWTTESK